MRNDISWDDIVVIIILIISLIFAFLFMRQFKSLPTEKKQEIIDRSEFIIKNLSDKYFYNEVWQKENRGGKYKSVLMRSL